MLSREVFELAIIAFILIGIGTAIYLRGAANPVGTGKLQRDMTTLKADMARVKEIAKGAAKAEDVRRLEKDMAQKDEKIEEVFTCLRKIDGDLDGLQKEVAGRMAAVEVTTKLTATQVDRLYYHIVRKGMDA